MKIPGKFLIPWVWVVFSVVAMAQENIPIGTWRDHVAYNKGKIVSVVDDQVYCVSENGFFIYDPEDGGLRTVSRVDGLNDVNITAIEHIEKFDVIALGYDNGNIDIITGQKISNINDIKNSPFSFNRTILDIENHSDLIFFITGFGVVVYNHPGEFIKETWQDLGSSGDSLGINKAAILNDSIFLATREGVISGSLSPEINLLDFRNWKRHDINDGLPAIHTRLIDVFNNRLYAIQSDHEIFRYENGTWESLNTGISEMILSLKASEGSLIMAAGNRIWLLNGQESLTEINSPSILEPSDAIQYEGHLYVADNLNGMARVTGEGTSEIISPNGPFFTVSERLERIDDRVITLPAGFNRNYQPLRNNNGFSVFRQGRWENYNNTGAAGTIPMPDVKDLVDVTYDESGGTVYFASFGYGVMSWDQATTFVVYDENTPGSTLVNSDPPGENTLISSVDISNEGTLWITSYNTDPPLHEFDGQDNWQSFSLSGNSEYINKMIITENGDKWMVVNPDFGGGIIVYNEETRLSRYLTDVPGNGGLPDNRIFDLVEDREGAVWLASANGVAYFPFPFTILDEEFVDAIRPVYEQNFLFRNEMISALAVDGANRKWIGTEKGIWLFSEEGILLLNHFNEENSPLFSDRIIDIAIDNNSGEVFIGTDKGLLSYRGMASEPAPGPSRVKIFPNPVTPDFNGYVGIHGLPESSVIKITDVSGKLIFQAPANGGTATWNVRDYNGQRASSGIYLVFSATGSGEETFVGKIAVIN